MIRHEFKKKLRPKLFLLSILIAVPFVLSSCWQPNNSVKTVAQTPTKTPPITPSANLCAGAVTHKDKVVIPELAKPDYMKSFQDPVFGASVTRITEAKFDGIIKPAYNTIQAWNADESLLMLYHTGSEDSGHHLYNGQTYEYIQALNIRPADLEEVFWDRQKANIFYYVNKAWPDYASLMRYDTSTHTEEVIRSFRDVCGEDNYPGGGNDVQMMSVDSDKIGLRCKHASSADPKDKTFFYSISSDTISPILPTGTNTKYAPWDAVQPASSGERFFLGGDVLDSDLNIVRTLDTARYSDGRYKPEHASLGQLSNGNDAFFSAMYSPAENGCNSSPNSGIGALTVYDLETGSCRVLVGEDNGYGYPPSGTHPSALSYKNPGWVAASSIGNGELDYLSNNTSAPVLLSEIYLVNSDEVNPTVCRLAHHRSHGKSAKNGTYNPYFGEPHPVISPSGTRILFGSDWHDSGSVDSYVIELSSFKKN